jgi:putative peptidoglycan lipid II flippase
VLASTAIALGLMGPLGVLGVVVGAVIAAWVETLALGIRLRRQIGGLGLEEVRAGRIAILGAVSTGMGATMRALLPESFGATTLGSAVILAAFGLGFLVSAPALGLFDPRSIIRRR